MEQGALILGRRALFWSRDGSALAFVNRGDIWLLPLVETRARPFVQSKWTETCRRLARRRSRRTYQMKRALRRVPPSLRVR